MTCDRIDISISQIVNAYPVCMFEVVVYTMLWSMSKTEWCEAAQMTLKAGKEPWLGTVPVIPSQVTRHEMESPPTQQSIATLITHHDFVKSTPQSNLYAVLECGSVILQAIICLPCRLLALWNLYNGNDNDRWRTQEHHIEPMGRSCHSNISSWCGRLCDICNSSVTVWYAIPQAVLLLNDI